MTDAETTLTPVMRNVGDKGIGQYNYGRSRNDKFDALAAQSSVEADPKKREELIRAAKKDNRRGEVEKFSQARVGSDAEKSAGLAPVAGAVAIQQSAEREVLREDFIPQRFVECAQFNFDRAVFHGLFRFRAVKNHLAAVVVRRVIAAEDAQQHVFAEKLLELRGHVARVDEQAMTRGGERLRFDQFKFRKRTARGVVEQRERVEQFQRRGRDHV